MLLMGVARVEGRDEPGVVLPKPIVLRLDGHFTDDAERARAEGADAITIAIDGRERWFAVDRARTLGDHALDGRDVLAALAPLRPNLIAVGGADLRRRLRAVPPGAAIEVEGLVSRGSRTFLLRAVRSDGRSEPE
jgi:hypothetical protein